MPEDSEDRRDTSKDEKGERRPEHSDSAIVRED